VQLFQHTNTGGFLLWTLESDEETLAVFLSHLEVLLAQLETWESYTLKGVSHEIFRALF
jgi:hypothetical protein